MYSIIQKQEPLLCCSGTDYVIVVVYQAGCRCINRSQKHRSTTVSQGRGPYRDTGVVIRDTEAVIREDITEIQRLSLQRYRGHYRDTEDEIQKLSSSPVSSSHTHTLSLSLSHTHSRTLSRMHTHTHKHPHGFPKIKVNSTKCPPRYESIKTHIIQTDTYIEAQMSQLVFRKSQNGGYALYLQAIPLVA